MALKYLQVQNLTLAGSGVTATATSVTVSSFKHLAAVGSANVVTADLGDVCYATFEPGTGREEVISFTGVTQNADGTATLTGVTRNLKPYSPYDQYSATGLAHAGGSYLVVSDNPQLFDDALRYADDLTFAGAPNASTTQKGIVEVPTTAELNAGTATGATGAVLAATPDALAASIYGLQLPSSSQKAFLNATTGMISLYAGTSTPTGFLDCDGSAVSRSTYSALFAAISTAFGAGDGSTTFNVPNFKGATPIGQGTRTKTFTFVDANVNTGTDTITVASNLYLYTGQAVALTTSGVLPTGLSATTYYIVRTSATEVQLATTRENAVLATPTVVNITAAAGGGTHTFTLTMTARAVGDEGGEEAHALSVAELPSHTHTEQISSGSSADADDTGNRFSDSAGTTGATGGSGAANNMPPFVVVRYVIKT